MVDLPRQHERQRQRQHDRDRELDDALELLHFGFRKTVEQPDRVLLRHGLGRVHHRILFFVRRRPGLSVGGLIELLDISKQALARPLRELLTGGYLTTAAIEGDRRKKQLGLTRRGAALEEKLSADQRRRFASAFAEAGERSEAGWRAVMRRVAELAP